MIHIEGYDQAIAEERRDRAIAFLGQKETICGVPVVQMTPLHWEWFRATDNPYVCGGVIEPAHSLHALWMISEAFTPDAKAMDVFRSSHLMIHADNLRKELREYVSRMFMDKPEGKDGVPYYAAAASVVYAMAEKPFGWKMKKTMRTPLPIIFQLLKARDDSYGGVLKNPSDKIKGDWLREKNEALEKQRQKEARRAARHRAKKPPIPDDGR